MKTFIFVSILALTSLSSHAQNVPVHTTQPFLSNGAVQVASFIGNDFCIQLQDAIGAAVKFGYTVVDGSSIVGSQNCSVDPLARLSELTTPLAIKLGGVHIRSEVPWIIANSGVSLIGQGAYQTQFEYIGTSQVSAVLSVAGAQNDASTGGANSVNVSGIFIIGGHSNALDGLLLQDVDRSSFTDVRVWGVTNCGIHMEGNVSDRFDAPRVSVVDAFDLGLQNTHSTPAEGFCLDKSQATGYETTNSTFLNASAEGVTGIGIHLISAQGTVWTSGTSEGNGYGIALDYAMFNKFNTFIGMDIEGNQAGTTGVDVNDQGQATVYTNLIATSNCANCASVNLYGNGGQVSTAGYQMTGISHLP